LKTLSFGGKLLLTSIIHHEQGKGVGGKNAGQWIFQAAEVG